MIYTGRSIERRVILKTDVNDADSGFGWAYDLPIRTERLRMLRLRRCGRIFRDLGSPKDVLEERCRAWRVRKRIGFPVELGLFPPHKVSGVIGHCACSRGLRGEV